MAKTVYFGNGRYQTWIKAPRTDMAAPAVGYASKLDFLNGGSSVRRSNRSHRELGMSWTGQINGTDSTEDMQVIKDFYDGLYGAGPFYWLDPYAISSNLMPPHWAAPMLAQYDWPDLDQSLTPTFTDASYANGYPYRYATYNMTASEVGDRKVTIIIPSGYTLSFGWHSTAAGISAASAAGVRITPYLRSTGAATTVQNPASLLAGGTTRVSTVTTAGAMSQFDGATYSKVEIYLANGSASASSVNIVAMIAQVLVTGNTPATGGFISGRGTGALEFMSAPTISNISAAINGGLVEVSASFTEVV